MPANVFEWSGWQGHYRRTRRWLDRLLEVANDWDAYSMDEQIDFVLVFFQNCYHLRDYLLREQAVERRALDELMRRSRPLRICRDLANGSKHRMITSASVDSSPWIVRTLNFGGTSRLTLKADPELLDLVSVAASCLAEWDEFLARRGLDPAALSAPAQALVDAFNARLTPLAVSTEEI